MGFTPASSQPTSLVDAIAILMSWRRVGKFRAQVNYRVGVNTATRAVLLTADPTAMKYSLTWTDRDLHEDCDAYNHILTRDGQTEILEVDRLIFESYPARLAFPLSLPIWGRSFDDYRFTGDVSLAPETMDLHLVHSADSRLRGTLTVSIPLRMAVKLDTPTIFVAYEEVQ